MAHLVHAGDRGCDFSFARPPAVRLVQLGYRFIVAYISVAPASPAKNISRAECDSYLAAGLKVLLVWEMSPARANLGASIGATDGTNARTQAEARGYPTDVAILVADDTNTTTTNVAAQEAYMRAFAVACNPYPIGIYGDTDILRRCSGLWRIGWLASAWAWSGASRAQAEATAKALGAHVIQYTGFWIDGTWAIDPNICIADFPAWGTRDDPEGDDMAEVLTNLTAGKYGDALQSKWVLMDDGAKRGIAYPHEYAARGEPVGRPLSDDDLDGIPDWAPAAAADTTALSQAVGKIDRELGILKDDLAAAGHRP